MSDVTNLKAVVKLFADETKHIEAIIGNGKNLGADFTELLEAASEAIGVKDSFPLALVELKALDAAGIDALVVEITADAAFLPAKVTAVIDALASFIAPIEKFIALFKAA